MASGFGSTLPAFEPLIFALESIQISFTPMLNTRFLVTGPTQPAY